MSTRFWRKVRTATLLEHPRLSIVEDDVVLPQGGEVQYLRFEGQKDYVTVIAEAEGRIVLLREYSYPLDEWLWQLPEGMLRAGEDPVVGAARELAEEAGLTPSEAELIGMNYGNHRRSTQKNYVVRARGLVPTARPPGEPEEEGTQMHWFTKQEIRDKVRSGAIRQKNTLAALGLYVALSG